MAGKNISFKNKKGQTLEGKLTFPSTQSPKAFAIFAHCFTCGKNLKVIRDISNALAQQGIAVLRFDFTGLGQSEGNFEDSNFSHDVDDLIEASHFLENHYQAPSLIIGHSLGGTASLFAAKKLNNIKAVATIASPSQPSHVENLIKDSVEDIEMNKEALVNIGGRDFKIKKQFLDDIKAHDTQSFLDDLKKPFLILHSPQDQIVDINNAEELYKWAHHPKSFISLDKADHLLNDMNASYIGSLIASWSSVYIDLKAEKNEAMSSKHQSAAVLKSTNKLTTHLKVGDFEMIGDEPQNLGGNNYGPNPYDLLTASLAECTAMTLFMYARRKTWNLDEALVQIDHEKEKTTDENGKTFKQDVFRKQIELKGDLDEKQKGRLLEIADKCPVHKTLHTEVKIISNIKNKN